MLRRCLSGLRGGLLVITAVFALSPIPGPAAGARETAYATTLTVFFTGQNSALPEPARRAAS